MNDNAPLEYTDEQLAAAIRAVPELYAQVAIIAAQLELREWRNGERTA